MSKPEGAEHRSEPWLQPTDALFTELGTTRSGLNADDASRRLERDGLNRLRQKEPVAAWKKFLAQLREPLVLLLFGAAVLAGAVGDVLDAIVIVVVVLFNAGLGYYQEQRAEATLAALKSMLALHARVRRAGTVQQIEAEALVEGDIVLLDAGDRIPADGRVIEAHDAQVAEAALTGESHAVAKHADSLDAGEYALADRTNMVFMNTILLQGRLEMLVCSTGMRTEMGRITTLLDDAEESPTPLQVQLDALGKRLALLAIAVVALVFGLGMLRGAPLVETVMLSIALAVAAIPEGLPAVVTVTLAIGMRRMARKGAIVKQLAAVETLGSTTVICSDKTGTLTLNQMTAREVCSAGHVYLISGEGYSREGSISGEPDAPSLEHSHLLLTAALCNESSIHEGSLIGDPTEGALLAFAMKGGVEPDAVAVRYPRIAEIPFDPSRKLMATFHRASDSETVLLLVKGAPGALLSASVRTMDGSPDGSLDADARNALMAQNDRLASKGMRVLGLAHGQIPASDFDPKADLSTRIKQLTFDGLVGIQDPPRPEAREAIRLCGEAGIRVKMITGDQRLTADSIAKELGLKGEVLTGADLDTLDDLALSERIDSTAVFARVAPEHKVRIVNALKNRGHVVAMTGDGVNDAPALKSANIGVAMGITGTEVTKEAASMVLTDDNFATLVRAVEQGRTIYDNIVKFVRFQLSTNIGAILSVLGAQALGLPAPFTAIQLLWINIIMDGPPAMTLGLEPTRQGIMQVNPRDKDARILSVSRLSKLLFFGAIMAVGTLWVLVQAQSLNAPIRARTFAFTTFVLFQVFNVLNARAETGSVFGRALFSNWRLWVSLATIVFFQVVVVHLPIAQSIFHTSSLALHEWALAAALGSTVLFLEEARKLIVWLWVSLTQRTSSDLVHSERA